VSNLPEAAVEIYAYPAAPLETAASWWRPAELPDEIPPEVSAPLAVMDDGEDEPQAGALESEQVQVEFERRFENGKQVGFEEGRRVERQTAQQTEHAWHQKQLASLALKFDQETSRYLQEVEREVVALALAIAGRVLRREAQMDPLLLSGAVRAALGQLARTTEARLRVPASDCALWTEAMAHIPNLAVRPKVIADEGISTGDCLLETELGSVDLGIQSQLSEVEKSLFAFAGQTESGSLALKTAATAAPADGVKGAL
jgi:flagellar assembly protein FliH